MAARSGSTALYLVASELATRITTEPRTLVAEISARRSTVFWLYEIGAYFSEMRR
jgi:hypothetical protein